MRHEETATLVTRRDLAGPPGLPVLGNLLGLARGGTPHRALYSWRKQYGPTFRIRIPGARAIVTSAPHIIDTVLRQRPSTFRRGSYVSLLIDELGARGVFSAEGTDWQRLRRAAMGGLNAGYLRESFATITRSVGRLRDQWAASAATGERVDVLDDLMRYTLDVAAGLTMGYDLDAIGRRHEDGLHRRLPLLFDALGRRLNSPLPYWRAVRLPIDRRVDATVAEAGELIRAQYAEASRRMTGEAAPTNFLEALAKANLASEEPVNEKDVVGNVLTLLVAAEDTTAATAAWALHYLATHPDAQHRVRAEAAQVLGPGGLATDPATLARLPYAEAVVNEAIRLRPATPFLVVEPLTDTTVTDGTTDLRIDRGTPIFVLLTYGSDSDAQRYPDPGSFRPDRWLANGTTPMPTPADAQPFLPFGAGPRFCPGRNLALMEATTVVSMACHTFVIEADTSAGPVGERVTFALLPTNLGVRLRPVPPAAA